MTPSTSPTNPTYPIFSPMEFDDPSHSAIPVAASDFLKGTGPIDLALYQTPRQAVTSLRFFINLVVGGIAGWIINWIAALIFTAGKNRVVLWHFIKDYDDPSSGHFIKMFSFPIFLDLLLSALVTAFVGGFIGHFTLRFEVRAAKKKPIHPSSTEGPIYSAIGTHRSNVVVRSAIYMAWGVVISYPICIAILAISCSAHVMNHMMKPYDFTDHVCYLSRGWYCVIKGFYCASVTTLIAPLIEIGGLNLPNLSETTLRKYIMKKKASAPDSNSVHNFHETTVLSPEEVAVEMKLESPQGPSIVVDDSPYN